MKKISLLLLVFIFILFGCAKPVENETTTIETPIAKPVVVEEVTKEEPVMKEPVVVKPKVEEPTAPSEPTTKKYSNDKFLVGTDMPAGQYYVGVENEGEGSYAIFANEMAEGVLAFFNFENNAFVSVEDGQYLELTNAYAVPIKDAPNMVPSNEIYYTGMYRVGVDIPAGEYVVSNDGDGKSSRYTITNDMNMMDTVKIGELSVGDTVPITLEEGQYLILEHSILTKGGY